MRDVRGQEKCMDATWPKKAADSFWLAAARSLEQRRISPTQFQMLLIPAVVCSAFSIELGIKAILLRSGQPPKTHNLAMLFEALPSAIQDQVVLACGMSRKDFDAALGEAAKLFEKWRYVYEMDEPQVNLRFVTQLADAVRVATDLHAL